MQMMPTGPMMPHKPQPVRATFATSTLAQSTFQANPSPQIHGVPIGTQFQAVPSQHIPAFPSTQIRAFSNPQITSGPISQIQAITPQPPSLVDVGC